jgi:tetratricopeptide (TPR) repeat protein
MRRRISSIVLVLLTLLLVGLTGTVMADLSAQFKEAEEYVKTGNHAEAEKIYQQVITNYPGTGDALQAQEKLTCLYVTWGKDEEAQTALDKLKANFSDFPQQELVATAITHVGNAYCDSGKYEKACEVYSYVVSNWPRDEHGMWSQMGLVIANSCLGNNDVAETAFGKLCSDYSGQGHISRAVCLVADNYRKLEKHKKASELYQHALTNWPDAPFALWSKMGLAISSIRLREFEDANSIIEKLKTDFSKDERIPAAACQIADEYRRLSKYDKACELYQYVMSNWTNAEYALWSQMGLAITNIRQGNYDAARAATDKLLNGFSKDERLSAAVNNIADEYRRLKNHAKACELYERILDEHPESEYAFWAQMNLGISKIHLKDYAGAKRAVEAVLSYSDVNDNRVAYAARTLGDDYRQAKKYDEAFELYEYVVENHSKMQEALWSQMNLAIAKIALGDPNADAETQRLLADYSKNPDIPAALCWVADQYRRSNRHEEAMKLYKQVLAKYPQAEHAIWSQMNLAISNITLRDDVSADAAIKKLLYDFSTRKGVARAINNVAMWYRSLKGYEKSNEVLLSAIDAMSRRPQFESEIWPRATVVVSNIGLGDGVSSEVIDKLLTDFNRHPDMPDVMSLVSEAYWNEAFWKKNQGQTEAAKAYFQRALDNWEIIINRLPEKEGITAEAYYLSGHCYEQLGQVRTALERYQVVVENWPDFERAWSAQFLIGCCLEGLTRGGQIPLSEGAKQIRDAFGKVLYNYPDCLAAGAAKFKLSRWEKVE